QTPLSDVRVPIGTVLACENPNFSGKTYRVTGTNRRSASASHRGIPGDCSTLSTQRTRQSEDRRERRALRPQHRRRKSRDEHSNPDGHPTVEVLAHRRSDRAALRGDGNPDRDQALAADDILAEWYDDTF